MPADGPPGAEQQGRLQHRHQDDAQHRHHHVAGVGDAPAHRRGEPADRGMLRVGHLGGAVHQRPPQGRREHEDEKQEVVDQRLEVLARKQRPQEHHREEGQGDEDGDAHQVGTPVDQEGADAQEARHAVEVLFELAARRLEGRREVELRQRRGEAGTHVQGALGVDDALRPVHRFHLALHLAGDEHPRLLPGGDAQVVAHHPRLVGTLRRALGAQVVQGFLFHVAVERLAGRGRRGRGVAEVVGDAAPALYRDGRQVRGHVGAPRHPLFEAGLRLVLEELLDGRGVALVHEVRHAVPEGSRGVGLHLLDEVAEHRHAPEGAVEAGVDGVAQEQGHLGDRPQDQVQGLRHLRLRGAGQKLRRHQPGRPCVDVHHAVLHGDERGHPAGGDDGADGQEARRRLGPEEHQDEAAADQVGDDAGHGLGARRGDAPVDQPDGAAHHDDLREVAKARCPQYLLHLQAAVQIRRFRQGQQLVALRPGRGTAGHRSANRQSVPDHE